MDYQSRFDAVCLEQQEQPLLRSGKSHQCLRKESLHDATHPREKEISSSQGCLGKKRKELPIEFQKMINFIKVKITKLEGGAIGCAFFDFERYGTGNHVLTGTKGVKKIEDFLLVVMEAVFKVCGFSAFFYFIFFNTFSHNFEKKGLNY